jgi:hypothetical protein
MLDSDSSIAIERYNRRVALLQESFPSWVEEIRRGRCGSKPISVEPGSCGDIEFYLDQVKFEALGEEAERRSLNRLPTSFVLKPEEVDTLRDAGRRILANSKEFRRLLRDFRCRFSSFALKKIRNSPRIQCNTFEVFSLLRARFGCDFNLTKDKQIPLRKESENWPCGRITKELRKGVFDFTGRLPTACRKIRSFSK